MALEFSNFEHPALEGEVKAHYLRKGQSTFT